MSVTTALDQDLTSLVGKTIALLGEVVKEEGGVKLYNKVEKIRRQMASYRKMSARERTIELEKLYKLLEKEDERTQHQVTTSYSLMLELINICESAYRTHKIKDKNIYQQLKPVDNEIIFVLTAHPTEVRTTQNTVIFQRIENICIRLLDGTGEENYLLNVIKHNLKLAWLIPLTKHKKPEVLDEANHLFSIVLRKDILDTLLRMNRDYCRIKIRTWVGGDKDGHPGIDEKVMEKCLQASRSHFVTFVERYLQEYEQDLKLLSFFQEDLSSAQALKLIKPLQKIIPGDTANLNNLLGEIQRLQKKYQGATGSTNPRLAKIEHLYELFPALVIPLELREDSEVIAEALEAKKPLAISRMLKHLKVLAGDSTIRNYAQGFIISMCMSYKDFENALSLQKKMVGDCEIPVIPLFETAKALEDSNDIVQQMLKNKSYIKYVKSLWNKRLEVMLGYSDSSKGMGVFPSRLNIAKTMRVLDETINKANLIPVFFHGSGGSIDRGGGKLKDQTDWWPQSALNLYKATVQGEMVERYFTTPEVTVSNISKIIENSERSKTKSGPIKVPAILDELSESVKAAYTKKLNDELFFPLVEKATPYSYLSVLKLGSRPTKRSKDGPLDFTSIRAIPWILCWTQTRLLFPTWWGIGSSWKVMKKDAKKVEALKKAYKNNQLFASFVRTLGFTLGKIELNIFNLYLEKSSLTKEQKEAIFNEFSKELNLVRGFIKTVSGEKNILWHTPWLQESIKLRSSMIHPLNILQIIGHKKDDQALVRKSVAGISCGMLTTG